MLTFLIFVLILSILVLIHEFGHFYVAKKTGVRVEEFGFGIPPKVIGKKFGETLYSLNLLPFGGFVRLTGEDSIDEENVEEAYTDKRNFLSKTPLQKGAIVMAGVFMNILLAIFLYYVFFAFTGFKSLTIPDFFNYNFRFGNVSDYNTVVMGLSEDAPANDAGIKVGEAIIEIDRVQVRNVDDVRTYLDDKSGTEVEVLLMDMRALQRDFRTVKITPTADEEGRGVLGVYFGTGKIIDYNHNKLMAGPMHTYNIFAYSTSALKTLVSESFSQRSVEPVSSSVSGPVGIMSVVGGILDQSSDLGDSSEQYKMALLGLIDLTAILSISLAFLNALPFPALDGGRLVFIIYEGLTKRRVPAKFEIAFHQIGMLLLIGLLILVTFRDITRLF